MKWRETSLWRKRRNKLLKAIELPEKGEVLDLSCGDGQFMELIHLSRPNLSLYGIDISEEEIKKAMEQYPYASFSVAHANSIHFSDKSFDIIFCNLAFHHYNNPLGGLKELKRVLKDGGVIYIMDLFPKNKISQIIYNWRGCNADYHFEKYYTLNEIKNAASKSGLKIKKQQVLTSIPRLLIVELIYL